MGPKLLSNPLSLKQIDNRFYMLLNFHDPNLVEEPKVIGARRSVVRMLTSFLVNRYQCDKLPHHESVEYLNSFVIRHNGLSFLCLFYALSFFMLFNRILDTILERLNLLTN